MLNQELHAVVEWMKSNGLAVSILKTNFVLFHSKKLKPWKSLDLKIDGVNIHEVSRFNFLGVIFDSNLTWKNHFSEVCLKLSKTVGIFSKLGTISRLIAALPRALTEPHTHGIWSTSFRLVVT